jgi:hypothetical protein
MKAGSGWFQKVLKRLPLMQPGSLVVSSAGIGVFLGDWDGGNRMYGVKRGNRLVLERYPALDEDM